MIYSNISDLAIIFKQKTKNVTSLYYPKILITDKEKKVKSSCIECLEILCFVIFYMVIQYFCNNYTFLSCSSLYIFYVHIFVLLKHVSMNYLYFHNFNIKLIKNRICYYGSNIFNLSHTLKIKITFL